VVEEVLADQREDKKWNVPEVSLTVMWKIFTI
jgi:hypothetical protein